MLNEITSIDQFQKIKSSQDFFLLGFYTDKSETAKKAMQRLEQARELFDDTPVYTVNASSVKEIHPLLGVNSVPTVLSVRNGDVTKNIQGLQSKEHYELLFNDAPIKKDDRGEPRQPSVTVCSTPSCSWCT